MRKYLFFFAIFAIIFTSCEKSEELLSITSKAGMPDYKVRDGFLVFANVESFVEATKFIGNLSDTERQRWESKIGFRSQHSMFMKLINEELIKDSLNRIKYAGKDLSEVDKRDYHSEYYYEVMSKGVIKLLDEGTPDEFWDYSVFDRSFTQLINEDGLFAIADTLYQVTTHNIKNIRFSQTSTKQELLRELAASKSGMQKTPPNAMSAPGIIIWSNWTNKGSWPAVKRRIRIGTELSIVAISSPNTIPSFIRCKHNFYVQCQKTNLVNSWVYEFRAVSVEGLWRIGAFDALSTPQIYTNTVSYSNSVSDLKGTVNPESGTIEPWGTEYEIRMPWPLNGGISVQSECLWYEYYFWKVVDTNQSMEASIRYNY